MAYNKIDNELPAQIHPISLMSIAVNAGYTGSHRQIYQLLKLKIFNLMMAEFDTLGGLDLAILEYAEYARTAL